MHPDRAGQVTSPVLAAAFAAVGLLSGQGGALPDPGLVCPKKAYFLLFPKAIRSF